MKRVLFVDDERSVLDGLARMLRPMRHEWITDFASSGAEALERLSTSPFEVLVTDMRMPGMDGAELLAKVRDQHPDVVRIMLSGEADRDALLRAVRIAHNYLSKPCDSELLKTTVTRACALKELINNDALKQVVSSMTTIPSLPMLYTDLMRELQSPTSSIAKVGETIARDPGMSCKILQIVNSSFFGAGRTLSSPAQAVALLGTDLIKSLALSAKIFSQFDKVIVKRFSIKNVWEHGIQTGIWARQIARAENAGSQMLEQCLTVGLLQNVGKLVLAANHPDQYFKAISLAKDEEIPFEEAERQVLGATHAEVGAYLLGLWGLPAPVVEAVAWHHSPSGCPVDDFCPLTALHVANSLAFETAANAASASEDSQLDVAYLDRLGLTGRLSVWRDLVHRSSPESTQ